MVNYQNAKIYKIINETNEIIYIGSTAEEKLCKRFNSHKLKAPNHKIILIENYACNSKDELRKREQEVIEENNNLLNKQRAYISEDEMEGRTLLILDDITNELKTTGIMGEQLKTIYQNNRHLGRPLIDEDTGEQLESGSMSSMILSQRTNNLPRFIRSQLTHIILFDCRSTKSEMETLFNEFFHCNKEIFNELLRKTFDGEKNKYNFLFIDLGNSKIYRNFDTEYIIPKTYL